MVMSAPAIIGQGLAITDTRGTIAALKGLKLKTSTCRTVYYGPTPAASLPRHLPMMYIFILGQ